ncbi:ABC transporter ATP-binding protein [Salinibacter ruber]|uniref:ABC transporter ATP-binding protein n=1 Tax=Salinibacter ruber TaxID=146919 RepID=UPI002073BECA|nr:ABC transporter ATP-binding protein [Salinibacter ruber]
MELVVSGVSKTYPDGTRALNDVSLTIPPGMFGLLGPNGAGKSTLMRTIATLQEPDSGSLHLGNINILEEKHALRKRLGYLPQDVGVYENETPETLLRHFATLKGVSSASKREELTDALLERVNLQDARGRKLGGFSGGMKQRFGIAVALVGDPDLIIVDEPTAGLDPAERVRFLNLLSEIGEESVVILSTHIVADVRELCTQMAIIQDGQIIFEGSPNAAIKALEGQIWEKTVSKDTLSDHGTRYSVISTKLIGGQPVIRVCDQERPGPAFEPVEPDLEDVYFTRMAEDEYARSVKAGAEDMA